MARYTGPKSKIARKFGEPIEGHSKALQKKNYPPGQHGRGRRKKQSEYAIQLSEKQKAKYIYGVLERQFAKMFGIASRKSGITGENLLQLLEGRLDNTVYRLGISPTRRGARQLVSHKHTWLEWDGTSLTGKFVSVPGRDDIPENIKEQLIVELYSK
jgi:small subunit ribosomal protein S4